MIKDTSDSDFGACTSKYKGVSRIKESDKYRAQIMVSGRKVNLGNYPGEIEAARAYDSAAKKLFGEFARVNFSSSGDGWNGLNLSPDMARRGYKAEPLSPSPSSPEEKTT